MEDDEVAPFITFGEWIRSRRRAAGMTPKKLAEACSFDVEYLRGIERGKGKLPSDGMTFSLARALGIPVDVVDYHADRLPFTVRSLDLDDERIAEIYERLREDFEAEARNDALAKRVAVRRAPVRERVLLDVTSSEVEKALAAIRRQNKEGSE